MRCRYDECSSYALLPGRQEQTSHVVGRGLKSSKKHDLDQVVEREKQKWLFIKNHPITFKGGRYITEEGAPTFPHIRIMHRRLKSQFRQPLVHGAFV